MMGWTCLQNNKNNKNNKTNGSKLLIPESGHLHRRMQEVGAHHHHPNPSNEQITHSPSPRLPFQKKEPRSTAKESCSCTAPNRTSLSSEMTENSGLRRIRLRQTRRPEIFHVCPSPHHSCSCTAGPAGTQQKGSFFFKVL